MIARRGATLKDGQGRDARRENARSPTSCRRPGPYLFARIGRILPTADVSGVVVVVVVVVLGLSKATRFVRAPSVADGKWQERAGRVRVASAFGRAVPLGAQFRGLARAAASGAERGEECRGVAG
ncbi:hypothetical protein KM043_010451 [Ampulex compressa]|nr:hypothetical protein KM043_010451 [Ampulex compressa]